MDRCNNPGRKRPRPEDEARDGGDQQRRNRAMSPGSNPFTAGHQETQNEAEQAVTSQRNMSLLLANNPQLDNVLREYLLQNSIGGRRQQGEAAAPVAQAQTHNTPISNDMLRRLLLQRMMSNNVVEASNNPWILPSATSMAAAAGARSPQNNGQLNPSQLQALSLILNNPSRHSQIGPQQGQQQQFQQMISDAANAAAGGASSAAAATGHPHMFNANSENDPLMNLLSSRTPPALSLPSTSNNLPQNYFANLLSPGNPVASQSAAAAAAQHGPSRGIAASITDNSNINNRQQYLWALDAAAAAAAVSATPSSAGSTLEALIRDALTTGRSASSSLGGGLQLASGAGGVRRGSEHTQSQRQDFPISLALSLLAQGTSVGSLGINNSNINEMLQAQVPAVGSLNPGANAAAAAQYATAENVARGVGAAAEASAPASGPQTRTGSLPFSSGDSSSPGRGPMASLVGGTAGRGGAREENEEEEEEESDGIILAMPSDSENLSAYQCLARKYIEFFQAKEVDLDAGCQGRNKPIVLEQVGVRCRPCAKLPYRLKNRAATYYPSKIVGIYQSAQNIANTHLNRLCQCLPEHVRSELLRLHQENKTVVRGGKKYWAECALAQGVRDTEDSGLRFVRDEGEEEKEKRKQDKNQGQKKKRSSSDKAGPASLSEKKRRST